VAFIFEVTLVQSGLEKRFATRHSCVGRLWLPGGLSARGAFDASSNRRGLARTGSKYPVPKLKKRVQGSPHFWAPGARAPKSKTRWRTQKQDGFKYGGQDGGRLSLSVNVYFVSRKYNIKKDRCRRGDW